MISAKEKALEILYKFYYAKDKDGYYSMNKYRAVQCTIIAVDEVIKTLKECETYKDVNPNLPIGYYQQVKKELEQML